MISGDWSGCFIPVGPFLSCQHTPAISPIYYLLVTAPPTTISSPVFPHDTQTSGCSNQAFAYTCRVHAPRIIAWLTSVSIKYPLGSCQFYGTYLDAYTRDPATHMNVILFCTLPMLRFRSSDHLMHCSWIVSTTSSSTKATLAYDGVE